MKEHINKLPYLPISNKVIIKALDGKGDKDLEELYKQGVVTGGVIFMIRERFAQQLRQDAFDSLSEFLKLDISAKASPSK